MFLVCVCEESQKVKLTLKVLEIEINSKECPKLIIGILVFELELTVLVLLVIEKVF